MMVLIPAKAPHPKVRPWQAALLMEDDTKWKLQAQHHAEQHD